MKTIKRPLKNQKGVALLMALFAMTILIFLATEISYDTNVEYISASQRVNKIKAYYAAKAGVEISLLRILIYKKTAAQYGELLQKAGGMSLLDLIWKFPFTWPPTVGEDVDSVTKGQIQGLVGDSFMDAVYATTISSEGGKIDINDIGSENEKLAKSTQEQIIKIFQREVENNEKFADKYSGFDFVELINNMADWIDTDKEGRNNSDERSAYSDIENEFIPPNQPFKTLEELHMVKGMEDELFNVLKNKVTIYGVKGVNINYASNDVIRAIDPQLDSDEIMNLINERRNDPLQGHFKDEDEFISFLDGIGINTQTFNETGLPLIFDAEYNFRIESTGEFANSRTNIVAITYDLEGMKDRYITVIDKSQEDPAGGGGGDNPGDNPGDDPGKGGSDDKDGAGTGDDKKGKKNEIKVPTGRPTVVYWLEM